MTDEASGSSSPRESLNGLEAAIEKINKGLPALPANAKEWIVKALPWIIVIAAIITLPAILAIFGLGALFGSLSYYGGLYSGTSFYITWALSLVVFVMELSAVSGLIKRKKSAWNILFYAALITAVSNLISLSIVSLIIGLVIQLYFLFQIRGYYK